MNAPIESLTMNIGAPTDFASPIRRGFAALTHSDAGISQTVVRVTLGAVMLPHGMQKAFGMFGGYGFEGTMGFLTTGAGLPWIVAFLVIAIELVGSATLIAGMFARPAALGIIAVMLGAIATSHLANGFFMNWAGTAAGEGYEYHLLVIAMAVAVLIKGAGSYSLDRAVNRAM